MAYILQKKFPDNLYHTYSVHKTARQAHNAQDRLLKSLFHPEPDDTRIVYVPSIWNVIDEIIKRDKEA